MDISGREMSETLGVFYASFHFVVLCVETFSFAGELLGMEVSRVCRLSIINQICF